MSEKRAPEPRWVLIRRRSALAAHILFQVLVVIGSQGPWYQPTVNQLPVGDPVRGPEFRLKLGDSGLKQPRAARPSSAAAPTSATSPSEAAAPAAEIEDAKPTVVEPSFWERTGFLAHLVLLCAIVAFFFTSYDLVADRDLQVAPLIASAAILVCALLAYNSITASTALLDDVIREVGAAGKSTGPGGLKLRSLPGLRPGWGSAMFMAAAPPMFLVSLYLTFLAQRQPVERK